MVKNNILIAVRHLMRNKVFSFINIIGLSISMVACLLIFKYIAFEKSYDDYHTDADRVYRIYRHALDVNFVDDDVASIFSGIAPALKSNMPEFEKVTRFIGSDKIFQSFAFSNFSENGEVTTFNIPKAFFADDDALDIFHFDWIEGGNTVSLKNPQELIISESFAKRFFGDNSALNKLLRFKNESTDFKITGVFKDLPSNTHFKFDVLCSFSSLPKAWGLDSSFDWGNFYTYTKLAKESKTEGLDNRVTEFIDTIEPWFKEEGISFKLQSVQSIHLSSHQTFELEANGDQRTVVFLSIVGIFIMIIAWVNYINLSTSRLVDRAKEVGIRKVLGSFKKQLIAQFLTESILVNGLAIFFSLTLLQISIGFFEKLLGIPISFFDSTSLDQTLIFIGLFALGSLLFGLYPALLFSRLKITSVLKGKNRTSMSGLLLRRGLTLVQYIIALVLIIGTLSVRGQLSYMQNQSLGFNTDQMMIVKKPFIDSARRVSSRAAFKNELDKLTGVVAASASSEIPGYEITRMRSVARSTSNDSPSIYAKDIAMDEGFIEVYEMKMAFGKSFEKDTESNALMLNESAARIILGPHESLEDLIDQRVYYEGDPYVLIGIVADFHQRSLKQEVEPQIYTFRDRAKYFSIKISSDNIQNTLSGIELAFNRSFESSHFDYFFMDNYFDQQYKSDRLFKKMFGFFSALAILITALGLFGLSLYNIGQRSKEVSIRKVLGASVSGISLFLTKEYFRLIGIASIIAIPLAYMLVNQWLLNFASRMSIGVTLFVVPVLIVFLLTLVTVGYQVLKVAYTNPSESLRYE